MATVKIPIDPLSYIPDAATNQAQLYFVSGTNFPVQGLAFDTTTSEEAFYIFKAHDYGSGNLTLSVEWTAVAATSGTFTLDAQIAAITPNTDSTDISTDALATATSATDTHLGTTAERVHTFDVTISNLDSLAADDLVVLRISRDVATDTLAEDAVVLALTISYSDT